MDRRRLVDSSAANKLYVSLHSGIAIAWSFSLTRRLRKPRGLNPK